ncbi:MAG: glutathione synthase [Azospirillaceae bacterium]
MSLVVAIQMDPIETVDIEADSTFLMAAEAQARGHAVYHYLPHHLSLKDGRVYAHVRSMTVRKVKGDHFALGPWDVLDLAAADVVLMRQDPPFDMAYITATHLLEHVHPATLVVNDPASVRNAPEKLFVTRFADVMPPTLISSHMAEIKAFRDEHEDIIVKPLFGNGGAGVFHLKPGDENLGALIEMFTQLSREPVIVQRYLPEIREGDKRIILIEGEPVGAVARIPASGEARANFHAGGRAQASRLTEREREICAAIGPTLRELGLIFVGIDVIGPYLTEINVTSPTGIQEINRLDGVSLEARLWDAIESRLERSAAA